jgi:hypothetical protein
MLFWRYTIGVEIEVGSRQSMNYLMISIAYRTRPAGYEKLL